MVPWLPFFFGKFIRAEHPQLLFIVTQPLNERFGVQCVSRLSVCVPCADRAAVRCRSANVYETSTETLFLGRQDSMQSQTLLGLAGTTPSKVLEVACGTGRFGTFLRDNHPQAEYTAVDLSPFYLQKARDNDAYWVSRQPGPNKPAPAKFVQAAAEALPFEDGAFDAVVNVYLFHEMPAKARREAVQEMVRVLAPGGTLSWTDSFQRGDRPALDESMGNFEALNEPHYVDYIQTDVGALFEEAGLKPQGKWMSSTSKTLSFTKPLSS